MKILSRLYLAVSVLAAASFVYAQDAAKKPTDKPAETKPAEKPKEAEAKAPGATHTVARGPLRFDTELDGVFATSQTTEIVLRPEVWADWTVVEAAPHGARAKQGDALIRFDIRKIDEALADAQAEQGLVELAAKQAQEDVRILEQSTPLDLGQAERAQLAKEDLQRFLQTDRPLAEKSAEFQLKGAASMLENQQEELRQLEKMYKADQVTEETEEIILKRTRHEVDQAKFMFETEKIQHDQAVKTTLPRRQETMERAARSSSLDLDKARTVLPLTLNQKKLALAKSQAEAVKAADKLTKLRHDRALMTVTAPAAGLVYYGRFADGKWSGGAEAADALRRFGKVTGGQIVMTILNAESLQVRVTVPEKSLSQFRPGQPAIVSPAGYADARLAAKVFSTSVLPTPAGTFEARLMLDAGKPTPLLTPAMTCKAKVLWHSVDDGIAVPTSAVFSDAWTDGSSYVFVVDAAGKPQKRTVTVGKRSEDKTEITRGLEAGEKILLARP